MIEEPGSPALVEPGTGGARCLDCRIRSSMPSRPSSRSRSDRLAQAVTDRPARLSLYGRVVSSRLCFGRLAPPRRGARGDQCQHAPQPDRQGPGIARCPALENSGSRDTDSCPYEGVGPYRRLETSDASSTSGTSLVGWSKTASGLAHRGQVAFSRSRRRTKSILSARSPGQVSVAATGAVSATTVPCAMTYHGRT